MQPKQPSSKKSLIILAVVVVLGIVAYFYYTGANPSSSSSLTAQAGMNGGDDSQQQVLDLLNQINSIHIDVSFFNDVAYKSLVDHAVVVPQQNVGRANPFASVPGAFVVPPSISSSLSTTK